MDFQKKYTNYELAKNKNEKIKKFMEDKNKNECYSFLLSLQLLIHNLLSKAFDIKEDDEIDKYVNEKIIIANLN